MAVFVRVSVIIHTVGLTILWTLGAALASALYDSGARVGGLAALLSLSLPADAIYVLITTSLLARRQMRAFAVLQVVNQLVLTLCIISALFIQASADSLIVGRIVFSYSTMLMAWAVYRRLRGETDLPFPTLAEVFRRVMSVRLRGHLSFGFANAVDKGLGSFLVQLPLQMVGTLAGERAAGYLVSALNGISHLSLLTSAVFDNMQAVIPQRVGQRDYRGLWHAFGRVLIVMLVGGLAVYGALVLFAPLVVPPLLGAEWIHLTPVLTVLALYGVVTTAGGIFGPLYRALNRLWSAIVWKCAALILALAAGYLLLTSGGGGSADSAAVNGAWMINIAFAVSIGGTGWISLAALRRAKDIEGS